MTSALAALGRPVLAALVTMPLLFGFGYFTQAVIISRNRETL